MVDEGLRRLAVAIIEQAWLDFLEARKGRSEEAKRWFFSADFEKWAEPLGYNVDQWRKKVSETAPDWQREIAADPRRFIRAHRAEQRKSLKTRDQQKPEKPVS